MAHRTHENIVGQTFNKLTVIGFVEVVGSNAKWECLCECGRKTTARTTSLRSGTIKSCGCLLRFRNAGIGRERHGMHGTRIYSIWDGMISRCTNPKNISYKNYGGRGIKVCDRWLIFSLFYADTKNGYAENLTIDRFPDVNGDYEPGNFRWVTHAEQQKGRRNNVFLEFNGERLILADWARKTGISNYMLGWRLRNGWSVEMALTTETKKRLKKSDT